MSKKDLADLRRDRKAAATAMQEAAQAVTDLESAEAPDADAIEAAQKEFDTAKATFDKLNAQVKRGEEAEQALADSAGSGDDGARGGAGSVPAAASNPADKGIELGFAVGALARCKGDVDKAATFLEGEGHSGIGAALNQGTDTAGGFMIPQPIMEGVIDILRPRTVMRRAGVQVLDMPAGELRASRLTASATAGYGGEVDAIAASEQTFGNTDMSFKKLGALVPVSNSLLRHLSPSRARIITDDILNVMAAREDIGFIRNDGTGNLPKGVRHWAPVANWLAAAVATGFAAADVALRTVVSLVVDADVNVTNAGWIMRASAKEYLASLRDTNGNLAYPSLQGTQPTLMGYPVYTTSQIPNNLGVGTNETEVYFVNFADMAIGDAMALSFAMSSEASYVDGGANTISAFQRDLTLMRAISEHDFAAMHDAAIAGFNATDWALG